MMFIPNQRSKGDILLSKKRLKVSESIKVKSKNSVTIKIPSIQVERVNAVEGGEQAQPSWNSLNKK